MNWFIIGAEIIGRPNIETRSLEFATSMSRRFMSKWANLNINKTRRLYKIGYWACSIYCKDLLILVWELGANFLNCISKSSHPPLLLAQILDDYDETDFVICAVRIISFLQRMVIRWLPYLVNLSPGWLIWLQPGTGQWWCWWWLWCLWLWWWWWWQEWLSWLPSG